MYYRVSCLVLNLYLPNFSVFIECTSGGMSGMDSDGDISIIQTSPEDTSVTFALSQQPIIPFSPLSTKPLSDLDRGSIVALQKAYVDTKRRLQESNSKNETLEKQLRELSLQSIGKLSLSLKFF